MHILKRIIPVLIIFGIVSYLIYNSKRSDYKNKLLFFHKNINARIVKIAENRGTKVYYSEDDFFYLESYKGVNIMKGDSLLKNDQEIKIYRKNKNNKFNFVGKGKPLKPPATYFEYFFF